MIPNEENTFCWYPFHMLALKEWQDGLGIVNASPCCNSIRPETPDPLNIRERLKTEKLTAKEIFFGEEMESIRQAMLEGKRHSACETCWRIEDRAEPGTKDSYRLSSAEPGRLQEQEYNQELIEKPTLKTIDFAFGENCNLRCRMCSPGLSNKLRIDLKYFVDNNIDTSGMQQFDYVYDWRTKFGVDVNTESGRNEMLKHDIYLKKDSEYAVHHWDSNSQWQNILDNVHELRHIKSTGGETLVTKPFEEFLDRAIETGASKNIFLEFHTNATKFNNTMIDKLLQFESLHLNLSIDSIGKNYEYIRYPMQWEKLDASLRNLLTKTHGRYAALCGIMPYVKNFSFNVVLSALNAHYLPELCNYLTEIYWEVGKWPEQATYYVDLMWPENKFTNVQFLPVEVKKKLIDDYSKIQSDNPDVSVYMNTAINFLKQWQDYEPTEQDRQNMLREVTVFDLSRKQNYRDFLHADVIEFLETPR